MQSHSSTRTQSHSLSLLLSPDLGQVVCAFLRCESAQRLFTHSAKLLIRSDSPSSRLSCIAATGHRLQQAEAYQSDR